MSLLFGLAFFVQVRDAAPRILTLASNRQGELHGFYFLFHRLILIKNEVKAPVSFGVPVLAIGQELTDSPVIRSTLPDNVPVCADMAVFF